MHLKTELILSLLVTVPSALAAVNGACSNGVKGICIDSSTCSKYSGKTSNGNCPKDPNNIKCCSNIPCKANGSTGNCMFQSECKGTTYSNLCPGGSNFKCCINDVGTTCSDQGISGKCIDTNKTSCSTLLVSGKCPGASNIKCCLNKKPTTDTDVGTACSDQGISGKCIDINKTNCNTLLVSGKCPGASNIKCCLSKVPPTPSGKCDIPLTKTTLTRAKFVSAVQNYAKSRSSAGWKTFSNNAGTIYDLSTQNGFNPEMVVIRAVSEGFSPGGSTNNYWGLACYNTGGSCASYSSFNAGVLAFIKNIKNNGYATVYQMMLKYAYIGKYWYNPGSSSKGGCYYFPYIKKYMTQSRINAVTKACASGACAECVLTTDEDQSAYAQWNVSKMAEHRSAVFGLSSNC